MRVVVASSNPAKLKAAVDGFRSFFGAGPVVVGVEAPSGVPDQPFGDSQTLQGALNRVEAACESRPDADFWVAMEGGLERVGDGLEAFAWIVVQDSAGRRSRSRTATFSLPLAVAVLVRAGSELGDASDVVFGQMGSKRRGGTVGFLTRGAIDRSAYYAHAVVLALAGLQGCSSSP
jgi:inosine/xanthosine triphosphatase